MSYKLICIDMDGTLLNKDSEVSKRNIEAIKKATDKGVQVAITTGRVFVSANYYADVIGVKTPIIASNGAYIRERGSDKVIYKGLLGLENCQKVIEMVNKYGVYPHFNTYDTIYTEKLIYSSKYYSKSNESLPKERRINIEVTSNWYETFLNNSDKILKCIIVDDDLEKLRLLKEELRKDKDLEVVSSFKNNVEVMKKGVSKGNAVEMLAKHYNIKMDEVICIGDSENDLSMIKVAGLGVAMGNGDEIVKNHADYITDSNNEDGVAKVIEKFVL
ncbi:Cof-type HAD-IIB family hydrolase [uncultured Clostridium sp.]|uniref:Cof-type HAD-IIB family hydrolase n=1 Tax=uncultured Clostridium sp. TaxID=59620 RepID=UPI0028E9C96C|nr:Cof-type HAD-IIB family hydrolase [uncultured Clostridium sp.]